MSAIKLPVDPYNIIITGVGGQGNVMASRVVGNMLSRKGLSVTIGETFGASQRGGSVMSHLRVSNTPHWSPQIPKGRCHLAISLEPSEALRILEHYGNPEIKVICNTRPVHAINVISGDQTYPDLESLRAWIDELSAQSWFLDATVKALELGNPILSNIIMIGAVAAINELPMQRKEFKVVMSQMMSKDNLAPNLKAFDLGIDLVS